MSTERISRERAGWCDGKRRPCRWCGKEPPRGRRTFCSDACVHEHKLRTSASYQAHHVLERDKGVCESCSLDCVAEMQRLRAKHAEIKQQVKAGWKYPYTCYEAPLSVNGKSSLGTCGHPTCVSYISVAYSKQFKTAWSEYCDSIGLPRHLRELSRRLWEMDHRVPVVEGGGDCGLDNLRTLCWRCHHRATADLAARRSRKRQQEKRARQPQQLIPGTEP